MNPWDKIGPSGVCVYCNQPCYEGSYHQRCFDKNKEWLESEEFKKLVYEIYDKLNEEEK